MLKIVSYHYMYDDTIVSFKLYTKSNWKEDVEPFLAILKTQVPSASREYNPATKEWQVEAKYWPTLQILLEYYKWDVRLAATAKPKVKVPKDYAENFYNSQAPSTPAPSAKSVALQLSEYLGVPITTQELSELKKLYRAKAREFHPDLGGDARKMSELNRLWTLYTGAIN